MCTYYRVSKCFSIANVGIFSRFIVDINVFWLWSSKVVKEITQT